MGFLRQTLLRFAELAPEAFRPASPEVAQCLERVGRNFRANGRPPGGMGHQRFPMGFNGLKQEGFIGVSRYY